MKLIKIWFINPAIRKKIQELDEQRIKLEMSKSFKDSMQKKANLFCEIKNYGFAINALNSML